MDKQTQFKIIQLTHQRDELITRLQDLAEELTYEDVSDIVYDITKLNKTLKKLMTNGNDE
jgi:predicted MarR family transcription regulator